MDTKSCLYQGDKELRVRHVNVGDDGGDADGNSNGAWRASLVMLPCMPEATRDPRALDGLNYIRVYLR